MTEQNNVSQSFVEFSERSGNYYSDVFMRIQKSELGFFHMNFKAMFGSFVWAALRGAWLLFLISFVIDLITIVNIANAFKYAQAMVTFAEKDYLVERYSGWQMDHIIAAAATFILGRIAFGWLADRIYARQYTRWRTRGDAPSGFKLARLWIVGAVVLLIVPLMTYRGAQFAPEERTCIKQSRELQAIREGAEPTGKIDLSPKARFDCWIIGEFPTLMWFERPGRLRFNTDKETGEKTAARDEPRENAKPVNLNTYISQWIDDGIASATFFYGFFFDSIRIFLNGMLGAITSVFVGSPWPITMGVLLFFSFVLAGPRTTIFVGATLAYLAIMGFWHTAMDTLSLVIAASIICVVGGLPLGVWVGKSRLGNSITTPVLDVMQTIPSFVYLLPAIAFLSIGKPPGILATVIFAMPPMVRLTALGIRQVPENTKEAALAFGANPRQLLTKVELPLALPSIMAGINQVVMMSLSMVVVAALIGAGGMGFIVTEALGNTDTGRGVLAGLGIALLAMMIDRVVQRANQTRLN